MPKLDIKKIRTQQLDSLVPRLQTASPEYVRAYIEAGWDLTYWYEKRYWKLRRKLKKAKRK